MKELMMRLWKDEEGQGMVEYGLIIGLIAVVVIVALTTLGGTLNEFFGEINTALEEDGG